ncbi:MAG: hypothetical protein ACRCZ0_12510 [Cetobacterium sp.]
MKMFLSALENGVGSDLINSKIKEFDYLLFSYFYIAKTGKKLEIINDIISKTKEILIDSGAHSFQKGKKVEWVKYTEEYGKWIKENDQEKILGYFEMDIDPAGFDYEYILKLRDILLKYSDKIIPVWHKGRGIKDFYDMCDNPIHKDKIVAITGFRNEDIKDEDYLKFLKYAWSKGCKVHCLGMTRKAIIDKVPFDFIDSSTWRQAGIYWRLESSKVSKHFSEVEDSTERTERRKFVIYLSFLEWRKKQKYYFEKWDSKIKEYKRRLLNE